MLSVNFFLKCFFFNTRVRDVAIYDKANAFRQFKPYTVAFIHWKLLGCNWGQMQSIWPIGLRGLGFIMQALNMDHYAVAYCFCTTPSASDIIYHSFFSKEIIKQKFIYIHKLIIIISNLAVHFYVSPLHYLHLCLASVFFA